MVVPAEVPIASVCLASLVHDANKVLVSCFVPSSGARQFQGIYGHQLDPTPSPQALDMV